MLDTSCIRNKSTAKEGHNIFIVRKLIDEIIDGYPKVIRQIVRLQNSPTIYHWIPVLVMCYHVVLHGSRAAQAAACSSMSTILALQLMWPNGCLDRQMDR